MFSKSCEYGIKSVLYIAQQSLQNKRASVNEIAKEIDSPVAFTAKTLQLLAKEQLITSVKGKTGGYEIQKERLSELTLLDIVKCIDGDFIYETCGLGLKKCNPEMPCPIHTDFAGIRNDLKNMLKRTTILPLVNNIDNGSVFLKRLTNII